MPLFACRQCGCVENTACCNYWWNTAEGKPALCSECEGGKWHGLFIKRSAAGMQHDKAGFLWTDEEVAAGHAKRTPIIGRVSEMEGEARS